MKLFLSILCFSLFFSCNTSNKEVNQPVANTLHTTEDDAIKKAVDNAYKCISFKQGEKLNYSEIKNYFMPQAQFFNFRNDTLEFLTLDQFSNAFEGFIKENNINSFYEEEITGTTDQFGRIAQRMSTYKTYVNTMDSVAERGVNSFQLIKTPQGWKVSSIIWDVESPKLKIPEYYLKTDSIK